MNPALWGFLTGPARSWLVSQSHVLQTILVFSVALAYSSGVVKDFHTLFVFLTSSQMWFAVFLAMVFGVGPYVRAVQGAQRVAAEAVDATKGSTP